jgi:hypothetical protein
MANQTISCPLPTNLNPLSPNGFNFAITKLPDLTFFAQQVNLPGLTFGDPMQANPFASVAIPGDHITYDTLNVQYIIDSELKNYLGIYNWLIALGFPQSYTQYTNFVDAASANTYSELAKNYSDATLQILTPTNGVAANIQFVDLFPMSLDSMIFNSTNNDVQYLIGNATFRYSYYKFL